MLKSPVRQQNMVIHGLRFLQFNWLKIQVILNKVRKRVLHFKTFYEHRLLLWLLFPLPFVVITWSTPVSFFTGT
jgi:hypothetical protein